MMSGHGARWALVGDILGVPLGVEEVPPGPWAAATVTPCPPPVVL